MAEDTDTEKGEQETEDAPEEETAEEEATEDAEEDAGDIEEEEDAEEETEDAPARGKGRMINIAAIATLLLLIFGGGGAYFLGFLDPYLGEEDKKTVANIMLDRPVLHEFPLLKADMKTGKCKSPLLKTVLMVQLGGADNHGLRAGQASAQAMVKECNHNLSSLVNS